MNERDLPGMGDFSPPDEPDEGKASEEALIAAAWLAGKQCVDDLREIAEEEHAIFFRNIDEDPDAQVFGDWQGLWYPIYKDALDAFDEGVRLDKKRKQGEPQNA